MAYVRKTDNEWTNISNNINSMFSARIAHANDWYRYGIEQDEFDRICLNDAFPPHEREMVDKLGKRYFDADKCMYVRIGTTSMSQTTYRIAFSEPRFVPSDWTQSWGSKLPLVEDERITQVAKQRAQAFSAVDNERKAFVEKVKRLWSEAVSVNDFVRTWPAGLDLLSNDARTKLAEKTERAKSTAKEKVDIDELSVHMLKARVAS